MWHHLWAALNADKNWNPSPISNSLDPGLLKVSPQQQKTWHSQELCHHHLACQHNGCFTSWYYTWHKCQKPSFASMLVLLHCHFVSQTKHSTTLRHSRLPTASPREFDEFSACHKFDHCNPGGKPTETILLICASGDWWVKHHSVRANCQSGLQGICGRSGVRSVVD